MKYVTQLGLLVLENAQGEPLAVHVGATAPDGEVWMHPIALHATAEQASYVPEHLTKLSGVCIGDVIDEDWHAIERDRPEAYPDCVEASIFPKLNYEAIVWH